MWDLYEGPRCLETPTLEGAGFLAKCGQGDGKPAYEALTAGPNGRKKAWSPTASVGTNLIKKPCFLTELCIWRDHIGRVM